MAGKRKQRSVKLIGGAALLAVLVLVWLIVRQKAAVYETAQKPEKAMIIDLTAEQIKSISYTPESGMTVSFVREQGLWKSISHPDAELDQTMVGILAASVTGCAISHTMEQVKDLAQYGLDDPLISLSVTAMDGREYQIRIGNTNDMTMDVYCLRGEDDSTVYSVTTGLITDLEQTIDDYLKKEDPEESQSAAG